jgi:hypothetical protein
MTTRAQITAAPVEVVIDGEILRFSPLRDSDYGEFERWVQDRVIELTKRHLDGLPAEERQHLLDRAFQTAERITIDSPEAVRLMTTVDGACKLAWLSLRREHSDITYERVRGLLTSPEGTGALLATRVNGQNLRAVMDTIDRVNSWTESKKNGGSSSGRMPRKQKAPRKTRQQRATKRRR